jgi:hypothetical protein
MAVRNAINGREWFDGSVLLPEDLNDTFNWISTMAVYDG